MYFIYILRCDDGSLYTGITTDPTRRLEEHKSRSQKSARYTRVRTVIGIVGLWECCGKSDASKLEYHIKKLPKSKKEELLENYQLLGDFLGEKLNADSYKWVLEAYA